MFLMRNWWGIRWQSTTPNDHYIGVRQKASRMILLKFFDLCIAHAIFFYITLGSSVSNEQQGFSRDMNTSSCNMFGISFFMLRLMLHSYNVLHICFMHRACKSRLILSACVLFFRSNGGNHHFQNIGIKAAWVPDKRHPK